MTVEQVGALLHASTPPAGRQCLSHTRGLKHKADAVEARAKRQCLSHEGSGSTRQTRVAHCVQWPRQQTDANVVSRPALAVARRPQSNYVTGLV